MRKLSKVLSLPALIGVWAFVLCALEFSIWAPSVRAQVVLGSISGSVIDQSGAAVPGADVRITNTATHQASATKTDAMGLFHLALLPVGSYDLELSKEGFRQLALTNVEVNAAADTGLGSLKLEVGQVTTSVEVSAAPPLLETTQAQITNTVNNTAIAQFPGAMENQGLDFLALQFPGVVASRDNNFSNYNGVGFSVNGIRGRNNDQQIDGQSNNDNSVAGPAIFLGNPDFVQEYQVVTNNFGPEYGRNSGSVVNIITKAGTNNWHGDVFGTLGDSKLNSLSNVQKAFEGLTKVPAFTETFSGASIGGPIIKDKLFVFGGFDADVLNSSSVYATGNLTPTPAGLSELATCFPGSPSVADLEQFGPYGIKGGNPTPSGTPTVKTLTVADGSACPVEFAGVQRTLATPTHQYDVTTRVDYNTENNRFYGRYLYQKLTPMNLDAFGSAGADPAAGYPANVPSFSEDFGFSWTRTLTPAMINEARLSYGRLTVEFGGNGIGNTIPNQGSLATAISRVTLPSGYLSYGPPTNAPQGRIVNTYQFQDNWTYSRGRHLLKAGANITYQRSPNVFLPNYNGNFQFTLSGTEGVQNYALNIPRRVLITLGSPTLDFREHDNFFYFGDDVKVSRNLTLNLGLTYTYFGQPANLFHQADVKRENGTSPFFDPALPLSLRTFPSIPSPKNEFGPSAGFAYTPQWSGWLAGGGKLVLRGGYRLAYDPPYYNVYLNIASSAPQVLAQTLTGTTAAANPLPAQPFGPAVRNELAPFLTLGVADPRSFSETTITPDFRGDRTQEWSFGVQRELAPGTVVEVRYVGNHGSDLFQSINANPDISAVAANFYNPIVLPSGVAPCPADQAVVPSAVGRINCNLGVVRERTNTGVSDYEGLQAQLRAANLRHQLGVTASYTWSKTTDNVSEIFGTFAGANTTAFSQNPLDFVRAEHGLSGLDIPQNFTVTFVESLPFLRDQHGWVGKILGGWAISGSYILSSGQPYTPVQFAINNTYADSAFLGAFNSGAENLRPFLSSPSAPASNVGIFAADACADFGVGCELGGTALLSLNAINATGAEQTVTNAQVRFISNGPEANTVFGTPYGNAGRNTLRDYQTNFGNFGISKTTKVTERVSVRFHMDMLNVFNHPNYQSIDPFVDDAGFIGEATGFALPQVFTGSTLASNTDSTSMGQRAIRFGLRIEF
jgi:Carboxypeptidase regulatory-like domain